MAPDFLERTEAQSRPQADCYCRQCFTPVDEVVPACPTCDRPFMGAGRFDRLMGEPPRTSQRVETRREAA